MIDECFDIKNYLKNWGIYYRLKFTINDKEILFKDILFSELNDEDLYNVYSTTKQIAFQPMA